MYSNVPPHFHAVEPIILVDHKGVGIAEEVMAAGIGMAEEMVKVPPAYTSKQVS